MQKDIPPSLADGVAIASSAVKVTVRKTVVTDCYYQPRFGNDAYIKNPYLTLFWILRLMGRRNGIGKKSKDKKSDTGVSPHIDTIKERMKE